MDEDVMADLAGENESAMDNCMKRDGLDVFAQSHRSKKQTTGIKRKWVYRVSAGDLLSLASIYFPKF